MIIMRMEENAKITRFAVVPETELADEAEEVPPQEQTDESGERTAPQPEPSADSDIEMLDV